MSFDESACDMHLNCIVYCGDVGNMKRGVMSLQPVDDLQSDSLRSVADSSSGTFRWSRTAVRPRQTARPRRLNLPAED